MHRQLSSSTWQRGQASVWWHCFHHVSLNPALTRYEEGSMLTLCFSKTLHINTVFASLSSGRSLGSKGLPSDGVMEHRAQKKFSFSALIKKQTHTYHQEVEQRYSHFPC